MAAVPGPAILATRAARKEPPSVSTTANRGTPALRSLPSPPERVNPMGLALALVVLMGCRDKAHERPVDQDAAFSVVPSALAAPTAQTPRPDVPPPSQRSPRSGARVHLASPTFTVTGDVPFLQLCRTRECESPLRVPAIARVARPEKPLAAGRWFWRVPLPQGGFTPAWPFTVAPREGRAASSRDVDLDGDGIDELVLDAALRWGGSREMVALPLRIFDAPESLARRAPPRLSSVWAEPAGDVDGDGYADLLLHDTPQRVLRGGPRVAAFVNERFLDCPLAGCGTPAGDLDGDGKDDFLAKTEIVSLRQSHLVSTPTELPVELPLPFPAGDVDGDGTGDLLAFFPKESQWRTYTHLSTAARCDGTLTLPAPSDVSFVPAAGDVDGDGHLDAIVASVSPPTDALAHAGADHATSRVRVMAYLAGEGGIVSERSRTREASWNLEDASVHRISVGDADGDGFADVLVVQEVPHAGRASLLRGGKDALRLAWSSRAVPAHMSLTGGKFLGDVQGHGSQAFALAWSYDIGFGETLELRDSGHRGFAALRETFDLASMMPARSNPGNAE